MSPAGASTTHRNMAASRARGRNKMGFDNSAALGFDVVKFFTSACCAEDDTPKNLNSRNAGDTLHTTTAQLFLYLK